MLWCLQGRSPDLLARLQRPAPRSKAGFIDQTRGKRWRAREGCGVFVVKEGLTLHWLNLQLCSLDCPSRCNIDNRGKSLLNKIAAEYPATTTATTRKLSGPIAASHRYLRAQVPIFRSHELPYSAQIPMSTPPRLCSNEGS